MIYTAFLSINRKHVRVEEVSPFLLYASCLDSLVGYILQHPECSKSNLTVKILIDGSNIISFSITACLFHYMRSFFDDLIYD